MQLAQPTASEKSQRDFSTSPLQGGGQPGVDASGARLGGGSSSSHQPRSYDAEMAGLTYVSTLQVPYPPPQPGKMGLRSSLKPGLKRTPHTHLPFGARATCLYNEEYPFTRRIVS